MVRILIVGLVILLAGCSSSTLSQQIDAQQIAQSRINLGLAYLDNKQWLKARQNLEQAIAFAPKNIRARMGLAYYLQQVNEDNEAQRQYALALDIAPNDPDLLNNYGTFLCHIGKYQEAEKAFLQAIAQQGYYKLSSSYENAGLCAAKAKNWVKAKNWFEKAVSHEPNRYLSTLYLVKIEMEENAFSQVRNRLALFHQKYGYRAPSLLAMINLEKATSRPEQMKKYARLLAEQFPQSQEYRQYLDNEF